jgi:hypothetical protein
LEFLFYSEDLPSYVDSNHWIIFYFSAKNYSGILKINEESSDALWIEKNKLNNYNIAFNHREIIEKYFER